MISTLSSGSTGATFRAEPQAAPPFAYGEALQKSFLFYEAQRSGPLPDDNRIEWRDDSATQDGETVGLDLTGGYYEAGNTIKFSFPIASTVTLLSWGVIEAEVGYARSGQLDEALDAIRWGTDYLLKTHVANEQGTQALWVQVGDPAVEHARWLPPELTAEENRPAWKVDRDTPGSDIAAETAAALASASILFRPSDPSYADTLLENAIQLYDFADDADGNPLNGKQRGRYSDGLSGVDNYYPSSNYVDELMWGAVWLHKAMAARAEAESAAPIYGPFLEAPLIDQLPAAAPLGPLSSALSEPQPEILPLPVATLQGHDGRYLQAARDLYRSGLGWTLNWDVKKPGVAVLLAQETGDALYRNDVEAWLEPWIRPAAD